MSRSRTELPMQVLMLYPLGHYIQMKLNMPAHIHLQLELTFQNPTYICDM